MTIKSIDIFNTPDSWDQIMTWINNHSREERAHLMTAAAMAWNLAAKATRESEEETEDAQTW